jgi:hypothetical protein
MKNNLKSRSPRPLRRLMCSTWPRSRFTPPHPVASLNAETCQLNLGSPTRVDECQRHSRKVARHVSVWLSPPRSEFALKGRRNMIHWVCPDSAVLSGRETILDANQTLTCLATIHCRAATRTPSTQIPPLCCRSSAASPSLRNSSQCKVMQAFDPMFFYSNPETTICCGHLQSHHKRFKKARSPSKSNQVQMKNSSGQSTICELT